MINLATVLRLTRPLTELDLETTGKNPDEDRIVQINITRHYPDQDPVSWTSYINPRRPMPPETTARNHITDEMLADAPPFARYAEGLAAKLADTDYAGYNVAFDLRVLRAEFRRRLIDWDWTKTDACLICSMRLYHLKHPRDLTAAYKEYVDPAGFEDAHDAERDVRATEAVLAGQLARHPDLPRTVAELSDACYPQEPEWVDRSGRIMWRYREAAIGFGKHMNTPLRTMNKDYLKWMLRSDFAADTKAIVQAALEGRFPKKDDK